MDCPVVFATSVGAVAGHLGGHRRATGDGRPVTAQSDRLPSLIRTR